MKRLALMGWLACGLVFAQGHGDKPERKGGGPMQDSRCNEVPVHSLDLLLGRPTATSVKVNVLSHADVEGRLAYGLTPQEPVCRTDKRQFKKGEPVAIPLAGLKPDTCYYYQFQSPGGCRAGGSFHTARSPGSAFTFTVTADSHLDANTQPAIYQKTIASAAADRPDFHIDLGDTFMTEKHANRDEAAKQYLAQRYYLGPLCQSAPLFLVLGNHDGESPRGHGDASESLAVWSNTMRKRYFPNPIPDRFFTGDTYRQPELGLLEDYFAWQWGDAQFIVLDPFWFTRQQRGNRDNWSRTLGNEQYQWLKKTLEASKSKFKFVFIHHLVGGADNQCRGGAEAAAWYEWGGKNPNGADGFAANRSGWAEPIHQLLVRNQVNIVFHGHDHLYAKQDLDGIIYQEVPQPAAPGNGKVPRSAANYGYQNGVILGGSGYLRIAVTTNQTKVEYIHPDRTIAHRYLVPAASGK